MSYQFKKRQIHIIFVAKSFVFYCQLLRKNFKVVSFFVAFEDSLTNPATHTSSQAVDPRPTRTLARTDAHTTQPQTHTHTHTHLQTRTIASVQQIQM